MDAYVIGNLFGRALMAYVLVWFVCLLFARFSLSRAAKLTHSWKGLLAVFVLFLLPILAATGRVV